MDKRKIGLTLLGIGIIVSGAIISLVLNQYLLGIFITVPGFWILPSFNIPKSLDNYFYPLAFGFDIFILIIWFIAFLPENTTAIASLFGVSKTIIVIIGAWFGLAIFLQFKNNFNDLIDLMKKLSQKKGDQE